jgi:hypothetical protein
MPAEHRPVILSRPYDQQPLHELIARWSETVATPCLCGDMLLANPIDPGPGVLHHQKTERHTEWSKRVYTDTP